MINPLVKKNIPLAAASITIAISALTLIGYFFNLYTHFTAWQMQHYVLKFNTALCLFLASIALLIVNTPTLTTFKKYFFTFLAILIFGISFFILVQYILLTIGTNDFTKLAIVNLTWQTWLFSSMSAFAAYCCTILGIIFLLINKKKFHFILHVLIVAFIFPLFMVLINIIFNINFSFISDSESIRLVTVILLIILCVGVFYSKPFAYINYHFQQKIFFFFAIISLLVISIFHGIGKNNSSIISSEKGIEHTNEVLLKTNQILIGAIDIETGSRGYIITGDSLFLSPYIEANKNITIAIKQLKQLVSDNPTQLIRVDSLTALLNQSIETRKLIIAIRAGHNFVYGSTNALHYNGKVITDNIRLVIKHIEADEYRLLAIRARANTKVVSSINKIILLFKIILFVLLLTVFIIIYKNIRARNIAEKKLILINSSLEKIVEEKVQIVIEQEKKYHFLLQNMLEGIQIIGFDWRYIFVNNSVAEQSKYNSEELLGFTMMEKYPGIENTEMFKILQQCMTDRTPHRMENKFTFPDGSTEWYDLSIQPVPEGLFILSTDITKRKQIEEEVINVNHALNTKVEELAASNEELERFAYVASHDLQEPLRMVSSFLGLLKLKYYDVLDEKGRSYIHFAVDGAERMKRLILDLLSFSRLNAKTQIMQKVDCDEVLLEVHQNLLSIITENNCSITIAHLPTLIGNRSQLVQLFQNLISNAIKYKSADKQPIVDVSVEEKNTEWQFCIKDNGMGIDPKYFEKIFIIFQRLQSKENYSGTGIGLAIAKKIVERHGGRIWVESKLNEGSTFYFTISKKIKIQNENSK